MKLLSLGIHDAYLETWLARRFNGDGPLEIDGMELHPGAAKTAQERLAREGVLGKVVCGDALTAPEHFEPGSFDAVCCFELIEHVPAPDELLAVCEAMLKPGGRVYVSTPAGTFGAGKNPHHLRALRIHDLTDLLRARGDLKDAEVGNDGIATVSYTPAPRRGEIAIMCGPGWEPWAPIDIETRGLGGSETAAVRLGEALCDLGYVVTIYGECQPGQFRNLAHRHWSTFDPTERRAAVIASRMPEVFDRPVSAPVRALWLHDVDCGDRLTTRRAERIDHVLTLSKWHEGHVKGMYPFAAGKVRRIRNGIQPSYFTGEPLERLQRVAYISSPDRGLDVLLELWPRVLERAPDALLAHAYADVYNRVAEQDPAIAAHRDRIAKLSEQPGVHAFGSLSQPEVARLLRASLVWAHPSWATPFDGPFHETSCIAAMEAQAAGCLAVASAWGALTETVKVGRLVNGEPLSDRWKDAFVEAITEGLTDPETQAWAQREGPLAVAGWTWRGVAGRVAEMVEAGVRV